MGDNLLEEDQWSTSKHSEFEISQDFINKRSKDGNFRAGSNKLSADSLSLHSPLRISEMDSRARSFTDITSYFLDLQLEGMAGFSNLVTYSSHKADSHNHEDEYRSFKACLAACNLAYRRELMTLLFPVFSNLIIDLTRKGMWSTAQSMLIKYGPEHEEHFKEDIKRLTLTVKAQVIDEGVYNSIHASEQPSLLSKPVLGYLIQHISKGNHSILLEILNKYIQFCLSGLGDQETSLSEKDIAFNVNFDSNSQCNEGDAKLLKKLNASIEGMQKAKHKKASICLYSIVNAFQGLTSVTFSPNSHLLCGGFEDSSLKIWSLTSKRMANTKLKPSTGIREMSESNTDYICLRGHDGPVYSTDFLCDSNTILSASEDTSVRLWSLQHQTCLCEYRGHNSPVWNVSSNQTGSYFATASQDRTVRLWSSEYGYPLRIFAGHSGSVDCVTFHHNGNYIASGSYDKTCRLWDLQSGQFVRVLVGQRGSTYCLAFSADGKYLVSAGDCSRIMVWDLGTGKLVEELNGRNDIVYSLAFSKSGTFLASAGVDGVIELWNFKTGDPVVDIGQHSRGSHCEFMDTYTAKSCNVLALQFAQANLLYAAGSADHK